MFGRKSRDSKNAAAAKGGQTSSTEEASGADLDDLVDDQPRTGPFDSREVDLEDEDVERIDLGSLLITPTDGLELRLQVEENSGDVQSVLIAGPTGAVEVRAFAAQRNGDLWTDVRRQIASETARQGGTATEREGANGTELVCQRTVRQPDGKTSVQPSRIVGFNGPRWFLRATYLGGPAIDPDNAGPWEDAVAQVVVRRGDGPMAPGDQLPLNLPPQARRVE